MENAFLVDTTLLKRPNLWIFNKNRESALYEVFLGQGCNQSIVGIWNEKKQHLGFKINFRKKETIVDENFWKKIKEWKKKKPIITGI